MITAAQCRMARAALRWDMQDLAERAGVGLMTVLRFETEQGRPSRATLILLHQAFERAGVEFLPESGVRLRVQPASAEAAP